MPKRSICAILFLFVLNLNVSLGVPVRIPQNPRIVSGTELPVGALPWQVILKKNPSDDLLCGGSIIAPNWVLTAGHCTYGQNSIFLIFGTNNLNSYSISMSSTEFFLHPSYDPVTLNNDISLIKLSSFLTFSKIIKPIKLVSSSDASNSFLGTKALIAGYGYTDDEELEYSEKLLAALVDIIDNETCASKFGDEVVIESTMCGRGINGYQSICSGDSGGPLVTIQEADFIQIGINSFVAQDACAEGFPSGYARLTSFLSFIQSTMDENL